MPHSKPASLVEQFRHVHIADKVRLEVEKIKANIAHKEVPINCKGSLLVYEGRRYDPPEAA